MMLERLIACCLLLARLEADCELGPECNLYNEVATLT